MMLQWFILFLIFIFLFGYIGVLAIIITFLFYQVLKGFVKKQQPKEHKQEEDVEDNLFKLQKILNYNANNDSEIDSIESYDEILHSGSQNDKLELIGMVVYNPTKENVELIRIALNDKDEIVRILASNSLQKMEEYFFHEIAKLKKQIEDKSSENRDDLILELIFLYDRFISSTLIESSVIQQYIQILFEWFEKIENKKTNNYLYAFFSLCIKFNRFDKIIEPLQKKIEKEHQFKDIFLLAEVYFKQNRLDDLRSLIQKIEFSDIKNSKYEPIYEYWIRYGN